MTAKRHTASPPRPRPGALTIQPAGDGGFVVWEGGGYSINSDREGRMLAFAGTLTTSVAYIERRMGVRS